MGQKRSGQRLSELNGKLGLTHSAWFMSDVRYYVHMTTKTTISISDARKNIFAIAEQVQQPNVYYTLTDNGRPKAVVMSAEEFESWAETLEVMRDFPNLDKDIVAAERDMKSGKYKTYTRLEDLLHVSSKTQTKRRKKSR